MIKKKSFPLSKEKWLVKNNIDFFFFFENLNIDFIKKFL